MPAAGLEVMGRRTLLPLEVVAHSLFAGKEVDQMALWDILTGLEPERAVP